MSIIVNVPAGNTITASVQEGSFHISQVQDSTIGALSNSSVVYGPYLVARDFLVSENAAVAVEEVTTSPVSYIMTNDGAPDDAVQATLDVNPTGDDNGLTFTAKQYGTAGNAISIEYLDPSANDAALSVSVFNKRITVNLATGSGGAIESTAADVKTAIEASVAASRLVSVAILTTDSGTEDDGSGVVTAMAIAPLADGAGTGIGIALPGCICIDISGGDVYRNSGTQAAPAWTQLADVA
jgi:hypothetical protein